MRNRNFSRVLGFGLALGFLGMGLAFLVGMTDESRFVKNPTPVFAIIAAGVLFYALLRGPIGRAVARMLEDRDEGDDQLEARVDQLELHIQDLGGDPVRIAELEERLDFAERLLAQRNAEPDSPLRGMQQ